MNRVLMYTFSFVLIGAMAMPALAQPRGGPDQGPPGGGEGFERPEGPGGQGGGPGMMGGRMMRPNPPDIQKFEMLRGYIEVVDRFTKLSQDPTMAGVAAVISAADLLRQSGAEASIEYFNKVLPEVKNPAVQRAIRLQLVDLYKTSKQTDKALEQLQMFMKDAPATQPAK